MDQLLSAIEILPLESPADRHYGRIRSELENAGAAICGNDVLIAAQVLAIDAILVTGNLREFKRAWVCTLKTGYADKAGDLISGPVRSSSPRNLPTRAMP